MQIVVYEAMDEVEPHRRFVAQFEKISRRFYITCHGSTAHEARSKAQKFWDEQVKPTAVQQSGAYDLDDLLV